MSTSPTTMRVTQRPIVVSERTSAVRNVVASWQGRSLHVQATGDLLRGLRVLEAHEPNLYELSPHAPRLLQNFRTELAKPRHQQVDPLRCRHKQRAGMLCLDCGTELRGPRKVLS